MTSRSRSPHTYPHDADEDRGMEMLARLFVIGAVVLAVVTAAVLWGLPLWQRGAF
ncbi:MAG: hypothetical protein AB7I13_08700 [Vicinamibacterales bacterium]